MGPSCLALAAFPIAAFAMPAVAQQSPQFVELVQRLLPQSGAFDLAFGDVDGDGDLDLVCTFGGYYPTPGQNLLFLNDGAGIFADATATRMPALADLSTCVALADVDRDGDLDLVFGSGFGLQNRLYFNNGSGAFTDVTTTRMPADRDFCYATAVGDVDGDGDLDLVFGNDGQNRLYLNNGAGTFTDVTATRLPVDNARTFSAAVADVDGDGDLDLVSGNWGSQNRIYVNDGSGNFTDATAARMPVDGDYTESVVFGDVDRDGDLDLICGNNNAQNRLYLNDGAGNFTDATVARMPIDREFTASVTLGDVDGDGDLDLVCGNDRQQDRMYLNNGSGFFVDATTARMPVEPGNDPTTAVVFGDVDGDGDLDLAIGGVDDHLLGYANRLYLNDGAGTFTDTTTPMIPPSDDNTHSVVLGDIDGDGDLDLACGNALTYGQQNRLYRNDGTGNFTDVTAVQLPVDRDNTWSLAFGDVDRDGDLDLVCSTGNRIVSSQNRLYLNDGTGTFTDGTALHLPFDNDWSYAVALGDVDGDNDLDIVFGNGLQNRLYLNNGVGFFTDVTAAQMPVDQNATMSLALGDVDGDGDLDLVCANSGPTFRACLYVNDGSGNFTDVTAAQMPAGGGFLSSVALGDVDGDGDLDLAIGIDNQRNRLYLNDGAGTFTDATNARMPPDNDDTGSIAFAKLDEDGDLDLVCVNGFSQTRLYLNDGTGTFVDATSALLPVLPDVSFAIAIGDVDNDIDPDIVLGNLAAERVLVNLRRQLHAPHPLRSGRPFTLDAYSRRGPTSMSDVALPYLSTMRVSVPLPPYGILGINPMFALPPILIPQPTGRGSVSWNVPNVPALAGIPVHAQALVVTPLDLRLTNVTTDVIWR